MDSPTIHASCPKSGVFQKYSATGKATIVTQKACENTTESGGSVLVITLTNNLVTAKHRAENIAAETPGGMPSKVGRMITNAPIKPATNAPHLQGSDFSPKKIIDWFDHPLSIIITLFKEFPAFDIIKHKSTNKKDFQDQLQIKYFFKNFDLYINLNLTNKKQRNIEIFYNENSRKYDFLNNNIKKKDKKIYKNKITSLENLYYKMESKKKFLSQNVNFHEKIFLEKLKIIKKIKKLK